MMDILSLVIFGCHVRVQCQDAATRALLVAQYGHMQDCQGPIALQYSVGKQEGSGGFGSPGIPEKTGHRLEVGLIFPIV